MNIILNGRISEVSDEDMDLFQELVNRIVNADVAGVTGNADFDVTSPSNDISMDAELHITYGIFKEVDDVKLEASDIRNVRAEGNDLDEKTLLEHADEDFPDIDGQIEAMEI